MTTEIQKRAAREIAEFQHRNESLHRHSNEGTSCGYCDLVGHYAVMTLVRNEVLLVMLAREVRSERLANRGDVNDLGRRVEAFFERIAEGDDSYDREYVAGLVGDLWGALDVAVATEVPV